MDFRLYRGTSEVLHRFLPSSFPFLELRYCYIGADRAFAPSTGWCRVLIDSAAKTEPNV